MTTRANIAVLLLLAFTACESPRQGDKQADAPVEHRPGVPGSVVPVTELQQAPSGPAALEWRLEVALPGTLQGPRMAELFVRHTPDVAFDSATALDAVTRVGKQVLVQPAGDGRLRVLVFSSGNTERLGSGAWVNLRFRAPAQVSVVYEEGAFAPSETQVTPSTVALVPGAQP